MKLLREMFGSKTIDGKQAGDSVSEMDDGIAGRPSGNQTLKALFARADGIRAQNGLGATTDSSAGAQVVLTSIAMEVLRVAEKRVHPESMDPRDAALAWAYVCCMSVPIIAIVDGEADFDHQAFVLAVASAVFQFYDNQTLVQIIQEGTGLFQTIVAQGEKSQAFLNFNDQVHGLVLSFVEGGAGDAISGLRERYSVFGKLIS